MYTSVHAVVPYMLGAARYQLETASDKICKCAANAKPLATVPMTRCRHHGRTWSGRRSSAERARRQQLLEKASWLGVLRYATDTGNATCLRSSRASVRFEMNLRTEGRPAAQALPAHRLHAHAERMAWLRAALRWQDLASPHLQHARDCSSRRWHTCCQAVAAPTATDGAAINTTVRKPPFPFTRIAGQEEMKLGLLLNIIDPNIGGVLIMGDRGTGKSVAVRCHHALLSTDILRTVVRKRVGCAAAVGCGALRYKQQRCVPESSQLACTCTTRGPGMQQSLVTARACASCE